MNTRIFETKSTICAGMPAHRVIRLDELRQLDGNIYTLDNVDIRLSDVAQEKLNKAIGTNHKQLDSVESLSGSSARTNFRNYLSVAKNNTEKQNIVLIADQQEKIISDIIVLKDEFIEPDQYFDFLDIFAEQTNMNIHDVQHSYASSMNINAILEPQEPYIQSFAPGEDFVTNGYYLHYNGESIALGSYFTRLICANGQVEKIHHQHAITNNLEARKLSQMIDLVKTKTLTDRVFNTFSERATQAMNTAVSLREMTKIHDYLTSRAIGLPTESVDTIIPYNETIDLAMSKGVNLDHDTNLIKTPNKWWDIYNNLTDFATHTDILERDNVARTEILKYASMSLSLKKDIQNYVEI